MKLPEINKSNISNYLSKEEMVLQTVQQIMKDFGLFGIEITFSGDIDRAYYELHDQLVGQIARLLDINSTKLLSVLYQIDISERELVKSQKEMPEYDHVENIAHQIIVRELKKVLTRQYFKNL